MSYTGERKKENFIHRYAHTKTCGLWFVCLLTTKRSSMCQPGQRKDAEVGKVSHERLACGEQGNGACSVRALCQAFMHIIIWEEESDECREIGRG